MSKPDSTDKDLLLLHEVLEEEFTRLHGELPAGYPQSREEPPKAAPPEHESASERDLRFNEERLAELYRIIHELPREQGRSALCLSGGGIRSATFALGVIQGLAGCGLLNKCDYLSTVSGGGYSGSWLTAWIYHRSKGAQGKLDDRVKGLKEVKNDLKTGPAAPTNPKLPLEPEPKELRHLRDYSNYLSPRMGFLSADTWTLVGTYLRNLLLNWTVLIPLLAAVLVIPRFCVAVVRLVVVYDPAPAWLLLMKWAALPCGLLAGAVAITYMGVSLPSSREEVEAHGKFWEDRKGQGSFLWWCLLPLSIAAVFLTTFWAWVRHPESNPPIDLWGALSLPSLVVFVLFGILLQILGWLGCLRWTRSSVGEFAVVAFTGVFGGWLAWIAAVKILPAPALQVSSIPDTELYVCFAFPLLLTAFLLALTLFAGLFSRWTNDEDREWWARSASWVLIVIVFWSLLSPLVIFGPILFFKSPLLVSSLGGITGIMSALAGWSAKTAGSNKDKAKGGWLSILVNNGTTLAALAFFMVLLAALSLVTGLLAQWLSSMSSTDAFELLDHKPWPFDENAHLKIVHHTPVWLAAAVFALLGGLCRVMSRTISINRFSLHAMYRSRLIRAYLGASRQKRSPNPFTGFDPQDNIEMWRLLPEQPSGGQQDLAWARSNKLLHVVNITLNLVHGSKLAWQQRKAESFTVSPLHCGNYGLGYRRANEYGKDNDRLLASREERAEDRAITLGTAVTISGAAVSPNMGYHSSPVISFLLTLFNLRLGCWLGNPGRAGKDTYRLSQPKFGVRSWVAEAFGLTDNKGPYVYLSDGGHFENLGLYEMVLRRCRFIVVSDAGCDPEYTFEDLGNAIRKIRIDLGVPIEFDEPIPIHSWRDKGQKGKRKHCAIGHIRYSQVDGRGWPEDSHLDGVLIYLKPVICGDESPDALHYAEANQAFPHESTGDQFFSESQFESYRLLGLHTIEQICRNRTLTGFDEFAEAVCACLAAP